ncbi:MAG: sigma-70 family RNA polymerase sigma factor [Phycisphaerae bacterium]|nr:sigma-70 family RNA polymerase sigma factor [Phycisphaerae bacterium]
MEAERIAEVIARAQQRDPGAFDVLIEAYSDRLYGYFYRLTGRRDDADDLLQDLFVRLVRRIGEYQHDGRFDAWLFRIATNLVRDRVRRARRARTTALDQDEGDEEAGLLARLPDPSAEDPGELVPRSEQVDRLQGAIERLSAGEREVIVLRHFSRMSFREIADVMGTPLGTALARAHRGLSRLRELMNDEEARKS